MLHNDNDLIAQSWGPHVWESLHNITFGYPLQPTNVQKNSYKNFFSSVAEVLPCHYCRDEYKHLITYGSTKLTEDTMNDRQTVTRWLYDVHEAVNKKLKVNSNITYEDVVKKYESYRAICTPEKECTITAIDKNATNKKTHKLVK